MIKYHYALIGERGQGQTFPRPCGYVSFSLGAVGDGFGSNPEVVSNPISQVLDFYPEWGAAFQVHCNNLTDTWL